MARYIKLLVPVAGSLGDHTSPSPGDVLEVSKALASVWADGERAIEVDEDGTALDPPVAPPAVDGAPTELVAPPAVDGAPTEFDALLDGTVSEILTQIGDDRELAAAVLAAERAGKGRKTLIDPLDELVAPEA